MDWLRSVNPASKGPGDTQKRLVILYTMHCSGNQMKNPRRSIQARFLAFWDTDRSLTALLVLLVLAVFIAPSLTTFALLQSATIDSLLTLSLLAGIRIVSKNKTQTILLSIFVVIALVFRILSYLTAGHVVYLLRTISAMISLSILAMVVFTQVFRKGPITLHRVQGAVAGYLLLGLIWASAYELLELVIPGAIRNSTLSIPPETLTPNLIYFSFTTLTTVGYGDLTPVHHVARSLAMLEALTGQLFPAILIARLVSMELISSSKKHLSD